MSTTSWIVFGVLAWLVFVAVVEGVVLPRLRGQLQGGTDPLTGLLALVVRVYVRLVHRVSVEGAEHVPARVPPEGLVIVANHGAGVDPLLLQAVCPFHIRWMMLSEMMIAPLDWFWRRERIIAVDQNGRDLAGAREAIRHLKASGVLGIFPEGGIARPRGVVLPFMSGVGLLVARSHAAVLLTWIHSTPETPTAWGSLVRPSRSRVRFVGLMRFEHRSDAAEVAAALRQRLVEVSGWMPVDHALAVETVAPTATASSEAQD
ncbi:MAG: 1-acyl-sn-glycerol-3-phosphate acyltransferase [Phycisphaerales bacterium]|nr:1-acyl-sn-glycerol-3-phosphate acyltransferase [Phycisphaerales bacterium]